jgi:hypothetical protein
MAHRIGPRIAGRCCAIDSAIVEPALSVVPASEAPAGDCRGYFDAPAR